MRNVRSLICSELLLVVALLISTSGISNATHISVVNMVPNNLSGEVNQDSEPNLAVNPVNTSQIAGSAFTPDQGICGLNLAPIYVSTDGGNTWNWNCIVPSQTGSLTGTGDITLRFGGTTSNLYAGILRLPVWRLNLNILRTINFAGPAAMTVLVDRDNVDQPYIQATTVNQFGIIGPGQCRWWELLWCFPRFGIVTNDHVYVGDNDFNAAAGQTATIDQSLNAQATTPTFTVNRIEPRATIGQDLPPIRPAIASNNTTIYAAYFGWRVGGTTDVVVVRDDSGGAGANPFTALVDPGDRLAGVRVVTGRNVIFENFSHANFGQERLVASNLTIAVNPTDSAHVCVGWGDRVGTEVQTLHVRCSTDSGGTWSENDLRTITNATNPALAFNSNGTLGFLFQQVTGTGATQRWVTHLERTSNSFTTPPSDIVLADVPANAPALIFTPYIGDYVHLMAVGETFYGIFSANNTPNNANFPNGVTYQRNANFTTNTLLNTDNVTPVGISIDPFFFRVSPMHIRDICQLRPWICNLTRVEMEPGLIKLRCDLYPCVVMDPLPRNCLVKYDCPGCPPGALCLPYYNVFFDGLDKVWDVGLFDGQGKPVPYQQFKTPSGIVISFQPDQKGNLDGQIDNYFFAFEISPRGKLGLEYKVKTRLERSDSPYQPEKISGVPNAVRH